MDNKTKIDIKAKRGKFKLPFLQLETENNYLNDSPDMTCTFKSPKSDEQLMDLLPTTEEKGIKQ